MKNKLGIIVALLLIFALDGLVMAGKLTGSSPSFSPDGIGVSPSQQRRRRRRRRIVRRPRLYQIVVPADVVGSPPETAPAPVQQEMPVMSAPPPPPASDPMDAPGMGRPAKKAGPRIKPPTVQIKPPTK